MWSSETEPVTAVGAVMLASAEGAVSEIAGGVPVGFETAKVCVGAVAVLPAASLADAITLKLPIVFMVMNAWPFESIGRFVPPTVSDNEVTATLSVAKTRKVTFVPVVT